MSAKVGSIKFYANRKCTKPLDAIQWNNDLAVTLIDGTKLTGIVKAGQVITIIVYIRNEGEYRYGIQKLSYPDERIRMSVEKAWLIPNVPVKLTIIFKAPENPSSKNILRAGEINIKGFYVYRQR